MKALIFDHTLHRRKALAAVLAGSFETVDYGEVIDASNQFVEPGDCRLILLHQRGPDEGSPCGNADSWDFFATKLLPLIKEQKAALIAYTGGGTRDCPEPPEFRAHREQDCRGWCIYLNGVNGPNDLLLKDFASAWKKSPDAPPPLDILIANSSQAHVRQFEDLFRLFLDTELFLLYKEQDRVPTKLKGLMLPSSGMNPDWDRYFGVAARMANERGEQENWPFLAFSDDIRDAATEYCKRTGLHRFIPSDPLLAQYEEQWKERFS